MRRFSGWGGRALIALSGVLIACSGGGDDDPTDPDPQEGAVRTTVTGDGAALPGVTVRLFADGGVTALRSGTTAANGQVTFGEVATGAYEVDIVVPAGFELGAGGQLRQDVTVEDDETAALTFALEEIVVAPTVGQIRARVVEGTAGVSSVEVKLYDVGGSVSLATGSTAADGRVLFPNLDPGAYDVEITLPSGYVMAGSDAARKEASVTAGVITDVTFAVDGPEVVIVQAEGTSFTPPAVTVGVGATVRWQRVNGVHTVTPIGHTEWTEGNLDGASTTFDHTFDEVGVFNYECVIHDGMTGTVTVE